MTRYGMVIDLKKCIGCSVCTIACKAENYTRPGVFWNLVSDEEIGNYPSVHRHFLPRLCMHCQNPPCVEACPTRASYQREDGIVLVDQHKCMGCGYCVVVCPYRARYLVKENKGYFGVELTSSEKLGYSQHKLGIAEKCTFCVHRIERGQEPACVQACPGKARYFGDLEDPQSRVSYLVKTRNVFRLLESIGTGPSVLYLPP